MWHLTVFMARICHGGRVRYRRGEEQRPQGEETYLSVADSADFRNRSLAAFPKEGQMFVPCWYRVGWNRHVKEEL